MLFDNYKKREAFEPTFLSYLVFSVKGGLEDSILHPIPMIYDDRIVYLPSTTRFSHTIGI